MRTANAADYVCRTVLFVIGVQDEENIECAFQCGIRPVARFGRTEKHVQKISRIAELVIGVNKGHAQRMAISKGGDGGHLADQAVGLFLAGFLAEDVFGVVIESGERRDGRDHHAHGMGIVVKTVQKLLDTFVDEGVMADMPSPVLQLLFVG